MNNLNSNSLIEFIKSIEDDKIFLENILFYSKFVTLSNNVKSTVSNFYNDIVELFSKRLNENEIDFYDKNKYLIDQILFNFENYSNIENIDDYDIDSDFFSMSKKFADQYINIYNNNKYILNKRQQKIFTSIIDERTNCLYSMPTSFGKSLLIKLASIYRAENKKRTIICVPTLALINEYREDFNNMIKNKSIKISSNPLIEDGLIYVLTQERLFDFKILNEDILIIDESYEINDKNLRSALLKSQCNRFLLKGNKIKLFQPYVLNEKIPYPHEWKLDKFVVNTSLTYQEIHKSKTNNIKKNIETLSLSCYQKKEKFAIYSYKSDHYKYAELLCASFTILKDIESKDWINILTDIYSGNYLPIHYLKRGIIINNGDIPKLFRFITEKMVKVNNEYLNCLICNNTLSKGVNLGIKTLIINAKSAIQGNYDEFEISNLIGRVGRITKNFFDRVGNVHIVMSDKKIAEKIENIKHADINYERSENDDDKKKYHDNEKSINEGKFESWKYILNNKDDEWISNIIKKNIDVLKKVYVHNELNSMEVKNNFLKFIFEIFDGDLNFIISTFSNKNKSSKAFLNDLKNDENLRKYYIDVRTKIYIFDFVFLNKNILEMSKKQYIWYSRNNYHMDKKSTTTFITNKPSHNENFIKISKIKEGSIEYKKVFTKIINDIISDSQKFYENKFQHIEKKIIEILIKDYNMNHNDIFKNEEFLNILDKYNLPAEFMPILKENNINTIEEFEKTSYFKILIKN